MNTQQSNPTEPSQSGTTNGIVAVGLAIICFSAVVAGAIGAAIGVVMDDMAACPWGVAAGAAIGGYVMVLRFGGHH